MDRVVVMKAAVCHAVFSWAEFCNVEQMLLSYIYAVYLLPFQSIAWFISQLCQLQSGFPCILESP